MKEVDQTGGCHCGAVRYRFQAPSTWCAHVHHAALRHAHGAPVVTLTAVRVDRLTVLAGEAELTDYDTTGFGVRRFCCRCGTTVLIGSELWPEQIHVVTATLDGGPLRRPSANLFVDQAAEWSRVDNRLPGFGGEDGSDPIGEADLRDRIAKVRPGVRLATRWDQFELSELFRLMAELEWGGVPAELEAGIRTTLERDDHWILVAEGETGLSGFVDVKRFGATAEGSEQMFIDDIFVRASERRQNVGRRLFEVVHWLAGVVRADVIALDRRVDNLAAAAFFESIGYMPSDDVRMSFEPAHPPAVVG